MSDPTPLGYRRTKAGVVACGYERETDRQKDEVLGWDNDGFTGEKHYANMATGESARPQGKRRVMCEWGTKVLSVTCAFCGKAKDAGRTKKAAEAANKQANDLGVVRLREGKVVATSTWRRRGNPSAGLLMA